MRDPALDAIGTLRDGLLEAGKLPWSQPAPFVPEPGMAATMCFPNDRYPATVMRVSAAARTVWVRPDLYERVDNNGLSDFQQYVYRPDESADLIRFTLRKNGRWVESGKPSNGYRSLGFGWREAYFDPYL